MRVVVKVGTSSLTNDVGEIDGHAIVRVARQLNDAQALGHDVMLVTSGAIAAGLPLMGFRDGRPRDTVTLQAAAAVGQTKLMRTYDDAFGALGKTVGQVLLSPHNFFDRREYVHARETIERMLSFGVIPIANENDAIADHEIRFGDNDRIAALVAHAIHADLLVLLTDTDGLYSADPRRDPNATLIEEVTEMTDELSRAVGGAGSARGSGGMVSKLSAALMASWAGIPTAIASGRKDDIVADVMSGKSGVATTFLPRPRRLTSRKLWIGFAMDSQGTVVVDDGAAAALRQRNCSLLPAGVVGVEGDFGADAGVTVVAADRSVLAKGVCRYASEALRTRMGKRTSSEVEQTEVIHRDDLVVF